MKSSIEAMRELVNRLVVADVAYYKHDRPIMTDREYDKLYDQLKKLELDTGIILSGSPTQKVSGEVLEGLTQVIHTRPMLSAQKTKSADEVIRFLDGRCAVISWKLDGLTLVLRYKQGRLVQALTRGGDGGMIGEDVTHTVRTMMNVPLVIPCTDNFEVRGEGIISWNNFNKLNDLAEEPYAHPRNVAAGGIRRLDSSKTKAQFLEFFAFEIVSSDHLTKAEQLEMLRKTGFSVITTHIIHEGAEDSFIRGVIDVHNPKLYPYPVDGLIIEYDDLVYGRSLGATGHHENRLIALKWEDELYATTFLGLELATTRTGMVSLTGIFEDVIIDGATINRAYLHNLDILDRFNLGIGDKVQIYKANQIIPQLAENMTQSGTLQYPTECPCCGSALVIKKSDSGTRLLFCDNPACAAKLVRKFIHFCDKTRMNLEGFSEKTLSRLLNAGLLKTFGSLYELRPHFVEMTRLPGFGPTLVERLLKTVEASRQRTLAQFIAALGIPMVGRSAGRVLDLYFHGDWGAFEQAIKDDFDFTQLKDFGQTMHNNIYRWYANEEEGKLWRPLLKHITFIKQGKENDSMTSKNPFFGKTVVATGKLHNYTRDGIQAKLTELGAIPTGAVSKNTDYLIVGEKAGSKLTKAQQLGVMTLTEAEFEAMLADEPI